MQHSIEDICHGRFLDLDTAMAVAETSRHVYRDTRGDFWAGTMTVDAFVEEVKLAQGDRTEEFRQREIARRRGGW